MKVAPRARGPTSENLQGRKPREVGRGGASDAMGISVLHRSVDRLFGKRSMARRVCFVDRDRQNHRGGATASMVIAGREPAKQKCTTGMFPQTDLIMMYRS